MLHSVLSLLFFASSQTPESVTQPTLVVASAADVPVDYAPTPNGYYHRSCVHPLESGATVDASGQVTQADGSETTLAPCAYPHLILAAHAQSATGPSYTPPGSWVMDSIATSSAPVTRMTANFTVPDAPATVGDQVIFFFPGVRPADGSSVLQPVLQWGSGSAAGGRVKAGRWRSWACAAVSGGSCPYSTLLNVKSGDKLYGEIDGINCAAGGCANWTITTTDQTTGETTTLNASGLTEPYVLLFGGVLESYNVNTCADYPTAGKEVFTDTHFYDADGNLLSPAWLPQYDLTTYCTLDIDTTATSTELDFANDAPDPGPSPLPSCNRNGSPLGFGLALAFALRRKREGP